MHQKRQSTTTKLPITRKGTKYVARASSHLYNSVPVVIAIRDMLKLAKTLAEVKKMIKANLLKINGKNVKDYRESIKLFNILEADKIYQLRMLPTKRFVFNETKEKNKRVCKIINKKLLKNNKIQLNLHDGTNLITKDKISVHDSVYLNLEGKIISSEKMEKGKPIFVMSGKYAGKEGKIDSIDKPNVLTKLSEKEEKVSLPKGNVIVL